MKRAAAPLAPRPPREPKPLPSDMAIECRSCGQRRTLEQYRLFQTTPTKYMDFCVECEKAQGTITLYRRFYAYATKEIAEAVYAAERTPAGRRTLEMARLLVDPQETRPIKSKEEVLQAELERRELCRRRLIYYTKTFQPNYKAAWVHQDIARRLEKFVQDVEQEKSPRLMFAMPPRTGKSLLASDLAPSWFLGLHPEWGIIGASYSIALPMDFSRNIRDRLRDEEHMAIFPDTRLRTDSQGIESWKTTRGGGYIAAGVGTGINGKGMHIGIGDDLLKDAEAASSEVIRKAALVWFQSVFYPRLAPGGGILLIGTRWNDADVQGALLDNEEMLRRAGVPEAELDNWEVVSYPAIAEDDEYLLGSGEIWRGPPPSDDPHPRLLRHKGAVLHPERYTLQDMLRIKNLQPPHIWSALYQQNPTPDDGEYFKRDDFRYRTREKDYWLLDRRFLVADYAIGTKKRNDYTVFGVLALDANDDLYVLKIIRGRMGTHELAAAVIALVERYKPEVYAGEQGQLHAAVWPVVEKALQKKRLYLSVDNTLTPVNDKEMRARALQARMQTHKLYFVYDNEQPNMYVDVEHELLRFPNGKNDDIVDMLAWGARLALKLSLPTTKGSPRLKSWRDKLTVGATSATSYMSA